MPHSDLFIKELFSTPKCLLPNIHTPYLLYSNPKVKKDKGKAFKTKNIEPTLKQYEGLGLFCC